MDVEAGIVVVLVVKCVLMNHTQLGVCIGIGMLPVVGGDKIVLVW